MKNKTALTRIVLFAITLIFLSCGLNPFPFDGDIPPTQNVLSKKDSLAVRAILDANGLDTVKVHDVIDLNNSCVAQINLDNKGLTTFIFTNAFDSLLNNTGLNLMYNQIDTLIFLDTITLGLGVELEHNKLRVVPDDIDKMRGKLSLYFDYNGLTSISPNILRCNVYYINVEYNHLISVPDSISRLLTSKDSTWMNNQTP